MSLETATGRAASKPDLTFVILIHQSLRADAARLAATIAALSPDDRGVPFSWVADDEVNGRSSKLRTACEDAGKGYVLAVPVPPGRCRSGHSQRAAGQPRHRYY